MKTTGSLFLLLTALAATAAALPNSDFSVWTEMPGSVRYWTKGGEFPADWRPVDRDDRPESFVRPSADGKLELHGVIASSRQTGLKHKEVQIRVRARGDSGRLRVMVWQYCPGSAKIETAAFPLEIRVSPEARDYIARVKIPGWHGEDEAELVLDGDGVIIESAQWEEAGTAASAGERHDRLTLPVVARPPVVDGNFSAAEWSNAVDYRSGFRNIADGVTVGNQSRCLLTSDGQSLYAALLTPIPPGGFRLQKSARDSAVWEDESLEFIFHPDFHEAVPKEFYQLVISFAGVVFNQHRAVAIGQLIPGWDCPGLEVKDGFFDGHNVLEIKIPLASIGVFDPARPWGMTVGRNFALQGEHASLGGNAYFDAPAMLECRVDPAAPAIAWGAEELRRDGLNRFALTLATADPAQATYNVEFREIGGGKFRQTESLAPTPAQSSRVVFDLSDAPREFTDVELNIADHSGKIFFQNFSQLQSTAYGVRQRAFASPRQLEIEHFPFQRRLALRLTAPESLEHADFAAARLQLTAPDGSVTELTVPQVVTIGKEAFAVWDQALEQEGIYRAEATVFDRAGNPAVSAESSVPIKPLPWAGNDIGISSEVIAPFTPLRLDRDTMNIACVLRDYRLAPGGFPAAIAADGGAVLAAPVTLELLRDGKLETGHGTPVEFTRVDADRIEFRSGVDFPGLHIAVDAWMEYDGVIAYTLTLEPEGGIAVEKLSLALPVADGKLFHFINDSIRSTRNYFFTEEFPATGNAPVWNSTSVKNTRVYGNFLASLWLGNHQRGLSFFAESDAGWIDSPEVPCYELRRHGGDHTLTANFIAQPAELSAPRRLRFGLIATPVRPKPTGLSQRQDNRWSTSFGMGYFNVGLSSLDPWISNQMIRRDGAQSYLPYTAGNETVLGDPELQYFRDEIATVPKGFYTETLSEIPYAALGPDRNNYVSMRAGWTPERVDFNLWRLRQLFETTGIDGVYFDNTFPNFNCNLLLPNAGFIRDDGHLQGTFPVFLAREYLKRAATLAAAYDRRQPRVVIHNTNAQLIGAFAFADSSYDGEMLIPENGDHYDIFYPAWPEISLGVNWGVAPGMITMLGWGAYGQEPRPNRAMYSLFKLYDISIWNNGMDRTLKQRLDRIEADFGTAEADCTFTGYWENDAILAPPLKVSFFLRPGRGALAYVANPAEETAEAAWQLTPEWQNAVVTDMESGKIVTEETLRLDPHDFRVFRLQ